VTTRPLRILLVEDTPGDARLVQELVRGRPEVALRHEARLDAGLAALAEGRSDLVLADLNLPDSDGLETVRRLVAAAPAVPVVVLTGQDDESLGTAAVAAGAQDYLVKGQVTEAGLLRAVRYAMGRHEAQARLGHLNQVLRAIRNVNQLIVREQDPGRLIAQACELLVETRGYRAVWLALSGAGDQPPRLAECGWGDALVPFRRALAEGRRPACWDGSRACAAGLAVLDPRRECRSCPLWEAYGHAVAAVAPVRHGGWDFGTLGICVATGQAIDGDEAALLAEVAGDLGLALHAIEVERQRTAYAQIVASSREAMALLGRDHRYIDANPSYGRLVGKRADELRGRHPADVLGAEFYRAVLRPPLEECLAGREARVETALEMPGAGRLVAEAIYSPCVGADGSVFAVAACIRDVTALRQAEAALAAERDKLRAVTSATPVALLLFDDREQLRFANPAAERLFGRRLGELDRHRCGDFLACGHRHDVPEGCGRSPACALCLLNQAIRDVLTEGRGHHGREAELELAAAGVQERMWLLADAEPLVLDGRRQCVMALTDVTARHRAEAARAQLEEQLRLAQKMEAVGALAGGVAHDFNNLLSVILSYTEFALESAGEGGALRNDLLEVRKAGRRAESLVRQLLAFSRRQVLQPVPLDLNEVVAGVEKMLRRVLGEDIELVTHAAKELGIVWADPGQMEQVLMNLVVNARDAMPEGGRLVIETANLELDAEEAGRHPGLEAGSYVQLAVSDTGCGMDAQSRARLFEPFFTTKEKGKGTGLGLSTVYGIVRQSGGEIRVYSEPGRGTTFKIRLPRVFGMAATTVRPPPPPPEAVGGCETVLVVEDEESLREVAQRTLTAAGYRVLAAGDGEEALGTAAGHAGEIHLLLADVVMPRLGGRALAERLAKLRPALKVLYTSGYTDNAIVHHGVLEPGMQFLAKPFTARVLLRRVREVLDGVESRFEARPSLAGEAGGDASVPPPDVRALRAIPSELREGLRRAAVAARHDELLVLLERASGAAPEAAEGLRRLAERFDYATLRALLERKGEEADDR
jgi:PAS domain S-box-containing protein